jgi:hypothetical protein
MPGTQTVSSNIFFLSQIKGIFFLRLDYEQIYRSTGTFPYSSANSNNMMMPTQVLAPPPPPTATSSSSSSFYTPNVFDVHNVYL